MTRTALKIIFAVLLVIVFAVGCENDRTTVLTPGNDLELLPNKAKDGPFDTVLVDTSSLDLEFLDSLEYEEFSGAILPGQGAWLIGEMKTWPGGGDFAIDIKPEALPPDFNYPVEFSMRIPNYQSYQDHPELPLIIRLEPSGINFLEPLTVMCTYMPWTGLTVDDLFEYFCLTPEFEEFGEPTIFEIDRKVKLMFQAHHFSIWGVGGGALDTKPRQGNAP